MAKRKYRKDYLTKVEGSQNWYLQFYIKPEYRQLPYFKRNPEWANRRNYLKTLKTPHYPEAVMLADKRLKEFGIRETPPLPPLSTGAKAFFDNSTSWNCNNYFAHIWFWRFISTLIKKLENLKSHLKKKIQPRLAWEITFLKISMENLWISI